jgi:GTP cyclohydrolase I
VTRRRGGPDQAGLERAFAAFMKALRVPTDDPELAESPRRAALAWATEFLDGYGTDPKGALGELSPAPPRGGLVVVTGLDYTGVCPHHLLPYRGVAHLAYQPKKQVAGFGRLAAFVDAWSHRLSLQETLAGQLADGLVEGLSAAGAAVVLEAEQTCLSMRGERRPRSRAVVEASSGRAGKAALERLRQAVKTSGPAGGSSSPAGKRNR